MELNVPEEAIIIENEAKRYIELFEKFDYSFEKFIIDRCDYVNTCNIEYGEHNGKEN